MNTKRFIYSLGRHVDVSSDPSKEKISFLGAEDPKKFASNKWNVRDNYQLFLCMCVCMREGYIKCCGN